MVDKECPTCGRDDFKNVRGMKVHHSRTHNESIAGEKRVCEFCGKTYRKMYVSGTSKYCSRECVIEKRKQEGMPDGWRQSIVDGLEDVDMSHTEEWKEEMSEKFSGRDITWGDKISESLTGKEMPWHKGEKNHNWNGGYQPRYGYSWTRKLKRKIRERDNRECQVCGKTKKESERKLDVHHIVPFKKFGTENHEKANREENLITLCRGCHMKVENEVMSLENEVDLDNYES